MAFDWGARPPLSATVTVWNETGREEEGRRIEVGEVVLSQVFDEELVEEETVMDVKPVVGNMTSLGVEEGVWSGRFARLEVEWCWEGDGMGATVGEWVVVGA